MPTAAKRPTVGRTVRASATVFFMPNAGPKHGGTIVIGVTIGLPSITPSNPRERGVHVMHVGTSVVPTVKDLPDVARAVATQSIAGSDTDRMLGLAVRKIVRKYPGKLNAATRRKRAEEIDRAAERVAGPYLREIDALTDDLVRAMLALRASFPALTKAEPKKVRVR